MAVWAELFTCNQIDQICRWVNYQGLLEACVVGKLVEGEPALPNLPPPTMEPPKKGMLCIWQIGLDDLSCRQNKPSV